MLLNFIIYFLVSILGWSASINIVLAIMLFVLAIMLLLTHNRLHTQTYLFLFFLFWKSLRRFQLMVFAYDNRELSSNRDTNWFLMYAGIELQISYSTIKDFINLTWSHNFQLKSHDFYVKVAYVCAVVWKR